MCAAPLLFGGSQTPRPLTHLKYVIFSVRSSHLTLPEVLYDVCTLAEGDGGFTALVWDFDSSLLFAVHRTKGKSMHSISYSLITIRTRRVFDPDQSECHAAADVAQRGRPGQAGAAHLHFNVQPSTAHGNEFLIFIEYRWTSLRSHRSMCCPPLSSARTESPYCTTLTRSSPFLSHLPIFFTLADSSVGYLLGPCAPCRLAARPPEYNLERGLSGVSLSLSLH